MRDEFDRNFYLNPLPAHSVLNPTLQQFHEFVRVAHAILLNVKMRGNFDGIYLINPCFSFKNAVNDVQQCLPLSSCTSVTAVTVYVKIAL